MTADINQAIAKIKLVGSVNTRIIQEGDSKCSIEVRENNQWQKMVSGVTQQMAEQIVASATNRVILG